MSSLGLQPITDLTTSDLLLLTSDKSLTTFLSKVDKGLISHPPAQAPSPKPQMPDQFAPDVLRGTLDLLILKTLTLDDMHGWGIGQRIQQISRGILEVNQGSLYPALQRLEQKGWIASEWRTSDANRRAKYYRLTASGRRAVGTETSNWRRYVDAVDLILET